MPACALEVALGKGCPQLWEVQNAPEVLGAELEERHPQKLGFWVMESVKPSGERAGVQLLPSTNQTGRNTRTIFFFFFFVTKSSTLGVKTSKRFFLAVCVALSQPGEIPSPPLATAFPPTPIPWALAVPELPQQD